MPPRPPPAPDSCSSLSFTRSFICSDVIVDQMGSNFQAVHKRALTDPPTHPPPPLPIDSRSACSACGASGSTMEEWSPVVTLRMNGTRRADAWRPLVARPRTAHSKWKWNINRGVGGVVSLHHPRGKCVRWETVILVIYLCSARVRTHPGDFVSIWDTLASASQLKIAVT